MRATSRTSIHGMAMRGAPGYLPRSIIWTISAEVPMSRSSAEPQHQARVDGCVTPPDARAILRHELARGALGQRLRLCVGGDAGRPRPASSPPQ